MKRQHLIKTGTALSACLLMLATPAFAEGKADRARAAIAEASGKIDAVDKVGVGAETPRLTARAAAQLRTAQESLKAGHKEDSIAQAHRASELADIALGEAQKRHAEMQAAHVDQQAAAAVAVQDANARADSAQAAAASAAADAAAARAAAATPVIVAQPAPAPTTTVTTETVKSATTHPVKKKVVVRKPASTARAVSERTTTTVTTTPGAQ